MGHIFERELKGILSGNEDMIRRVTKSCSPEERSSYEKIKKSPFLVVRSAGSNGIDLIATRWAMSFPIEVKSSKSEVLRFSRNEKLIEQAQQMITDCSQVGLVPIYAFRHKRQRGDAWRVFSLDVGSLDGNFAATQKLIYSRLPKIKLSREGNFIMRFNEGMPLSKFIDYLSLLHG